jgi:hypothetical protein
VAERVEGKETHDGSNVGQVGSCRKRRSQPKSIDWGGKKQFRTGVTFTSNVQRDLLELREAFIEQLEERVDVLRRVLRVGNRLVAVRVTDLDGRVEEDDVGRLSPRVRVEGDVLALVGDGARTQLEEETGGGGASGLFREKENVSKGAAD